MNISLKTRLGALAASVFLTFGTVYLIADYALPETPAVQRA